MCDHGQTESPRMRTVAAESGLPEESVGVEEIQQMFETLQICDCLPGGTLQQQAALNNVAKHVLDNATMSHPIQDADIPLRFHLIHGENARISNDGLTARRVKYERYCNNAIVFSNRPMRQREFFEVLLERTTPLWVTGIQIGVTGSRPEDIVLVSDVSKLEANDTIVFDGRNITLNRRPIGFFKSIDLNVLVAGNRLGVLRSGEYLHLFVDGRDLGPILECRAPNVWAVLGINSQCVQVTLTGLQPDILPTKERHQWGCISGNVTLSEDRTVLTRRTINTTGEARGLAFSKHRLRLCSSFEIIIMSYDSTYASCLKIGITDLKHPVPITCIERIPTNVWYVSGCEMRHNSTLLRHIVPSLEWLRAGDRISLELVPGRILRILINSTQLYIPFENTSEDLYVVVELQGPTTAIKTISSQDVTSVNSEDVVIKLNGSQLESYVFSEVHGENVRLSDERRCATRTRSYNKGLVFVGKPLSKGDYITIVIDAINSDWTGTIGVGAVEVCPLFDSSPLPVDILHCTRPCWVATHDYININGQLIASEYGKSLEKIYAGISITMKLTLDGDLYIMTDSENLGYLALGLSKNVYPVFDIYGKCVQISIVKSGEEGRPQNCSCS